jgi:hypothetical protein
LSCWDIPRDMQPAQGLEEAFFESDIVVMEKGSHRV